jgi:GTP cyclohydrolase IB
MNKPVHIADVQSFEDRRRVAIEQVGIRGLRHPISVLGDDGHAQTTIARVDMTVSLPHDRKGTHMSRFIELLNTHHTPLDAPVLRDLLTQVSARLDAESARVALQFPWFRTKTAPVSGRQSVMDYDVNIEANLREGAPQITLTVVVPVTSLCPCSKEISDYGAHNQRSHVTVTVVTDGDFWIRDAVDLAESQASAELYGILKRSDEKYVTERAYDNPRFVEDLIRDVAAGLESDSRVSDWSVEVENFESIHNHSAWARVTSATARPR